MKRIICTLLLAVLLLSVCQGSALAGTLRLPAQVKVIGEQAFYGDPSFTEATLPDGAVSIGPYGFAYSGLKRITIPDSVTYIADNAFEGLSGLTIVSSSVSYARQYASSHAGITWEDSAPPVSVAVSDPLTRDNILRLLDAINPDGAYIIRNSSPSSLLFWFSSAATIGDGLDDLSTAVHEQCHSYCGTPSGFRYNSIQGKYMPSKEWIYIGDGQHIEVTFTDVFPSTEMVSTIPDALRTFRFDTYINGEAAMASIQFGVYGMLDEFTAYCWDNHNSIMQRDYQKSNGLFIWNSNSYLAYAEFRFYILHYMLYAQQHYPDVYSGILNNDSFRQAFTTIDTKFAIYAETQKNFTDRSSWEVLMAEMAKPEYVNMANLLKY